MSTPTMKDVAALAKVGVGTVSRVVNNKGAVKESTRRKVENAIKELNYQPNEYARGLKTNQTNTVALILPTIWHPFFSEFAYYVEAELENRGYKLLLCNSEDNYEKELEYIQMVQQNKVDGIIGITYSDLDKYVSANLPFVSIDRHFTEDVVYVTADNEAVGRLAVENLIEKGCTTLAYIGGFSKIPNETRNRQKYFSKEADKRNVTNYSLEMPEPVHALKKEVMAFITEHPSIDGIFTINDFMALDVIEILAGMGKKVPEDIQIIGCDGIKLGMHRPLIVSTIQQPVEEMAICSVQSLMKIIKQEPVESRIVLPVKYIDGKTTK